MSGLNAEQQAAVNFGDGQLLVLAVPGAGKTRVIVHRVAKLIERGIPAGAITLLTFTRKAAEEMRTRLAGLVDGDAEQIFAGTFHSFGYRLLRDQANGSWGVGVVEDARRPIGKIIRRLKLKLDPQDVAREIMLAQQRLLTPDLYAEITEGDIRRGQIATVYREYKVWKQQEHQIDYGDMVPMAIQILEDPRRLALSRVRCKHLLVDEFHDVSYDQVELMKRLVGAAGNVTVVADPDQTIYSFRGSDVRFIEWFREQYPRHQIIKLGQNYRSTPEILEPAHRLIQNNPNRIDKPLTTRNAHGERVAVEMFEDADEEAQGVAMQIGDRANGRWGDFAILYRCVTPETPILTSTLEYVPAGSLAEGDEVVAFDEQPSTTSVFSGAAVLSNRRNVRPCVRVETDRATVVVTSDHPFLTLRTYWPSGRNGGFRWKVAQDLVPGQDEIVSMGPVWEARTDFEAGWLSGILDGEGSVTDGRHRNFCEIQFSQRNNTERGARIHARARAMLESAGFSCRTYKESDGMAATRILGGFVEGMRALGEFRPERLIAARPWVGKPVKNLLKASVSSVERVGDREVVELATSKGTLIAAGLLSHNTNAQALAVESALFEAEIPFHVSSGKPFFELHEVKLLLAYLRLVRNRQDDAALKLVLNVPARYLGPETLNAIQAVATQHNIHLYEALDIARYPRQFQRQKAMDFKRLIEDLQFANRQGGPAAVLREVRNRGGFDDWLAAESDDEPDNERMRNVDELSRVAERWNDTGEFLAHVVAVSKASKGKGNRVHMLTCHRSKGLEFPSVMLTGAVDSIYPHEKALWVPGGEEEERRLFYVGMTRAMQSLTITVPMRVWRKPANPSRFLVEAGLLEEEE